MINKFKRYLPITLRNHLNFRLPSFYYKMKSYSQCGEDLIVKFLLDVIHGTRPKRYLDIGANHPFRLSNTALLYSNGGQGLLIEPNPYFSQLLRQKRPRDNVIECGVHFSEYTHADYYVMDSPTLNTFSDEELKRYQSMGHRLEKTLNVELKNINVVLDMAGETDFMSIDIEGLDKEIIEAIDWTRYRPTCVCVETLTYETKKEPEKNTSIIKIMESKNYFLYADTFVNSIFIDCDQWNKSWSAR